MQYKFYDLETSGLDADFDQILQFASVTTDEDLNPIAPPENLLCKPRPDVLPSPQASITHGILTDRAMAEGLCEFEFSKSVFDILSGSGNQCCLGYNSIGFDDERVRRLFYRNLRDPYSREYKNNNSRADILPLLMVAYALRPEVLKWPVNENGELSLRLQDLTRQNSISHEHAHDALSDVFATIAVAKAVKENNPLLFDHVLNLRLKKNVKSIIDQAMIDSTQLIHVSKYYGGANRFLSLILPIAYDASNQNSILYCDLRYDPTQLLSMTADEVRQALFTKRDDQPDACDPIPLGQVQINRMPTIFSHDKLLSADVVENAQLDLDSCARNAEMIRKHNPQLRQLAKEVFSGKPEENQDVDTQIYTGRFFTDDDRRFMNRFLSSDPKTWNHLLAEAPVKIDPRISAIVNRVLARNYPDLLSVIQQNRWREHLYRKFTNSDSNLGRTINEYKDEYNTILLDPNISQRDRLILSDLDAHVSSLVASSQPNIEHEAPGPI